ncbi:unnamed protein product [Dicrocoelium dendriticum]|nr:unnamed protein product [Dicrocoelium dendriticum]
MAHLNAFWLSLIFFASITLKCGICEDKRSYASSPTRGASLPTSDFVSDPHSAAFPDLLDPSNQRLSAFHSDDHLTSRETSKRPVVDISHNFVISPETPAASPHEGSSSGGALLQDGPQLTHLSADSSIPPVHHFDNPNTPEKTFHTRIDPNIAVAMASKDGSRNVGLDQTGKMDGTKLQLNRGTLDSSTRRSEDLPHEESSVKLNVHSSHHFDSSLSDHDDQNRPAERMPHQSFREESYDGHQHLHRENPFSKGPPQHTLAGKPSQRIPHEFQLDRAFVLPSKNFGQPEHLSVQNGDDFVSLTAVVPPAVKQCLFYTPVSNFVIDYQVIRGGSLDLGLFVKDPTGEPIVLRPPSPEASFSVIVPPPFKYLPYAVCLDNRKSSYAVKHVALSIDLDLNWDNPSEQERAVLETIQKRSLANARLEALDAKYLESWKALIVQLDNLFGRLRRIEHLQQKTDNFASIDKALMEANIARVTNGSVIQILIMLGVAALQVTLIRALFDFNSRFYRLWFGKRSKVSTRC